MVDLSFDLECPNCHNKFKQKLKEMTEGKSRKCSSCGIKINFTGEGAKEAQKALDDFERALKNLSKKITIKL